MGSSSCGYGAKHVSGNDHIGVGTADAAPTFFSDLARTHITVFAADTGDTERTLGLLQVESVEYGFDTELLHVQQELAHGRIRRLLDHFFLIGKCFFVVGDCLHVIVEIILVVVVMVVMSAVVVIVAMAAAGFRSIMVMCLLSVFTEPLLYIIRCMCCHFSTSFAIIYLSYQFSRL